MKTTYKIHPAIGIARVGDSPEQFYLAPESTGALPIACDTQGNAILTPQGTEQTTSSFKDAEGRVLRQAARFQIFVYDDQHSEGRLLKIGDKIQGAVGGGKLIDIHWHAYLANKKASWYEFQELEGEHGYAQAHPLRNASITGESRQNLIIDPGPQNVDCTKQRSAEFARGKNPAQSQTFPPPLNPRAIDTLGGLKTDDQGRLIVLGGHGCSGSYLTDFADPKITDYANNDGWFDDVADGPVTAILEYYDEEDQENRYVQVDESGWVIVGNPSYAPQIVNMITLDDVLYDLSVRNFAYNPYLYGTDFSKRVEIDPSDSAALGAWHQAAKSWNPHYYPYFYEEIWPILLRPYNAQWVTAFLSISHDAHEIGPRGDFEEAKVSQPPSGGNDPYRSMRMFIYQALRKPGDENAFKNTKAEPDNRIYGKPLMPLLCGDNPLTNELPSKFLTLTPTQIFLLHQWAIGKFINEKAEGFEANTVRQPKETGTNLDRGVLGNILGGSFCPGGEIGWIARNPSIYSKPYRIHWNRDFLPTAGSGRKSGSTEFFPPQLSLDENFEAGLEPGDLTKRSALPWQADFNECSTQPIDVTYEAWNNLYNTSKDPSLKEKNRRTNVTLWWPTHRPMEVYKLRGPTAIWDPTKGGSYSQVEWARGIPQTSAGDLKMVTAWESLGFIVANPYTTNPGVPQYVEIDEGE